MWKVSRKMGQQESKQKLEQITNSLHKIRKNVRNGKITANDVERIYAILQRYSNEIDVNLSKKVRSSDVYTAEQLIEITSKELDALKQEVNLDMASVPTNSFSRSTSKTYTKEKRLSLKEIKDDVEDIRQEIRTKPLDPQDCERLQNALVRHSQRLSTKKNKKNEVEAAQKLISSVTGELLTKQEPGSRRQSRVSVGSRNSQPEAPIQADAPKIVSKNRTGNLDDIENKLETLKGDIKTAESNKDRSRLHFLSKSIQTLMTDLQLINVKNEILDEERKVLLENNLIRAHHQIDKIKKQLSTENDISYLAELHKKEKKQKLLQTLDDIDKTFLSISKNLNPQNYDSEKQTFGMCKSKLNAIEEVDQEVILKKAEVSDLMLNLENAFTKIEMEERLNQAEWKHFQHRIDLDKFSETENSDAYKKHRHYLLQLKEYVGNILEVSQKVDEKKKYVLYNIDNNVAALDLKAKQNGNDNKVVLGSGNDVTDGLLKICHNITTSYSRDELKEIAPVLVEAKRILESKLNEGQEPELVRVKTKELESMNHPLPPPHAQLQQIQREVESLQEHIENTFYNKDSQLYKDLKHKLDSYKIDVSNLVDKIDDKFAAKVLKSIDNALALLKSNASKRKSTTEDILVDMMSVSTRVNDLSSKLQSCTSQDHDSVKNSLLEHQNYLKQLPISPNRTSLLKSRDDILHQIERCLSDLNNGSASTSEVEKRFNQDLRRVKDKVQRYSGTYKSVLYKAIENDLDKHLNKVDMVYSNVSVANQVKRDIENSRRILEQKSSKDQSYSSVNRDVRAPAAKELAEISANVDSVKRELCQVRPLTKEELDKLEARLRLSILALDNIKDEQSKKQRDKLYQDIHFYFERIQELMLVSRPQSMLLEDLQHGQMDQQRVAAETIASIESALEEVKPQILTFVGTETSHEFSRLDEVLVKGTLTLDELSLEQTSTLYGLKAKLMRELSEYSDILDEKIRETEDLEKLEKQVKVMLMKIDSFNGYFGDPEYTYLDEEIIRLKVNLGRLHVNQELMARREACIREVDGCMRKLNEAARARTDTFEGTLV